MVKKKIEETRRNGYYISPVTGLYYPSVTTVMKASGSPGGLVGWAAKMGAKGMLQHIQCLLETHSLPELWEKLSVYDTGAEYEFYGLKGMQNASAPAVTFGTAVHQAMEELLTTGQCEQARALPEWTEQHDIAADTLTKFFESVKFKVIAAEAEVCCDAMRYAGRLDVILEADAAAIQALRPYLSGTCENLIPGPLITDLKTGKVYMSEHEKQLSAYSVAAKRDTRVDVKDINGGLIINVTKDEPDKIKVFHVGVPALQAAWDVFKAKLIVWQDQAPQWWHKQFKE